MHAHRWLLLSLAFACAFMIGAAWIQEYKSGIVWPKPPVVPTNEPGHPPADAIVLFDGKDLSQWQEGEKWKIADGVATVHGGGITSKQKFGDCQIHLEFATPDEVKGNGQGRGNSGLFLMGHYEVQILDSYENETYFDGQCASIYKQQPPTVNACKKPGEWQTYDIIFTAPRFNDKKEVEKPGYVTVLHNGVVVHNHFELMGQTSYIEAPKYVHHGEKEPISLQNHGNPVQFRNIWVRENIQPLVGEKPAPKKDEPVKEEPKKETDQPKSDEK